MLAMIICTALVFLESTILPVAIPTIQKQIDMGQNGLYWTINAYLLTLACLVYVGGRTSDLLGHKKVFLSGMLLFGLASLVAGFAMNQAVLIIGRVFQGAASAFMMPASMSITLNSLNLNERGKGVGLLVSIGSVFLALGPFLGGFFTQYLSWRYVFFINIPIVVAGLLIANAFVPHFKPKKITFNFQGFIIFAGMIVFFTLAIMEIRVSGISSTPFMLYFFIFLLFLGFLVFQNRRNRAYFFDYSLFRERFFCIGNILVCIAQFLMMVTIFWSLFFQKILGYSPLESGLLILIGSLPIIICAPLSGYFSDNYGPKWPIIIGFALSIFSFCWLIIFPFSDYKGTSIVGLFLFGCSMSTVMTPVGTSILSSVPIEKRGVASGVYLTLRNIASTVSIALLGCLISHGIQVEFDSHIEGYPGLDPSLLKDYVLAFLQGHSLLKDFPSLSTEAILHIKQIIKLSTVTAFFWVNVVCMSLSILGFVLSIIYFNRVNLKKLRD